MVRCLKCSLPVHFDDKSPIVTVKDLNGHIKGYICGRKSCGANPSVTIRKIDRRGLNFVPYLSDPWRK